MLNFYCDEEHQRANTQTEQSTAENVAGVMLAEVGTGIAY